MWQCLYKIEVSCVFYVKGGALTNQEQSKTSIPNVNKMGICWLTIYHNFQVIIGTIYYTGDKMRQASPNSLSRE